MNKLLNSIEKRELTFWEFLLSLIAICIVRDVEETVLVRHQILDSPNDLWLTFITFFGHYNSFWFMVFLELVLLLFLFTKKHNTIKNCLVAGLYAMPVILLPPLLNVLIGDKGTIAYPSNPVDLIPMLSRFLDPTYVVHGVTIGMRIEIFVAAIMAALYVWLKTKQPLKSILAFVVFPVLILFTGSFKPILAQLYENGFHFSSDFKLYDSKLFHGGDMFLYGAQRTSLMYIIFILIMAFIILLLFDKRGTKAILRNVRVTRSMHYILLFGGGLLCSIAVIYRDVPNKWAAFANPMDYFGVFMGAVALFLAFQGAVVFNDLYDEEIDNCTNRPLPSGAISRHRYRYYGIVLFLSALYIGFCIGPSFFMLLLSYILLSYIYSANPFRCRQSLVLTGMILSVEAVASFAMGACLFAHSNVFNVLPTNIPMSLLLAYFLIIPIKDLKDCDGDLSVGIHTLPTLIGKKAAMIVTCVLVCFTIVIFPLCLGLKLNMFSAVCTLITVLVFVFLSHRIRLAETLLFVVYFVYLIVIFLALYYNLGI